MPLSRLARFAAIGFVLTAGCNALRAASQRIDGAIDSSHTVTLANAISPRTLRASDLGELSGDKRLDGMTLRFNMTAQQQAALTQLLADQQNPASPRYHQWLTPEQFAAQFGLSTADSSAVASWLSTQGFTVTGVSRGGLFVRFSGTAAQAEAAFHTQIHSLSLNGEQHFANVTAPGLPAAIASVTQGITGLDDFRPRPHHRETVAQPLYTTGGVTHFLAPGDFYTIYDEKTLLSGNVTGAGVNVAVVGQSDIYTADIAAFQKAAGLANKAVAQTLIGTDPGYGSNSDLIEAEMDLEWAGAVAPGANILYFYATNVVDGSLTDVIDNDAAPIVSTSYGECEADLGTSAIAYLSVLLQQAASQGMTITAASGDSGATDCDAPTVGSAVMGLAVDFPASSPLVTGIGGTRLNEGTGTYWSTTNNANGGSATAYIPEVVWNDDNGAGLDATGGGASDYFSKPSWQTGTGVPNDFSRDVPDVALAASIVHDGYLICTGSTNCTSGFANASGAFDVAGGTSVGAPAFAGLVALIEQKTGKLGNINPTLYALANSAYSASVFHDIISGNNDSPCTTGSVNCASGGAIGFAAKTGYDQATGWGSVDAASLVNDWTDVTPGAVTGGVDPSLVNIAGSATAAVVGTPIIFTVNVTAGTTPSPGTPTGTAQITVDSVPVGSSITLAAGSPAGTATATYTLATSTYSAGNHTVQATYSGDTTFAGSKAAFAITLTPATVPDFSLTPTSANVTVAGGSISPAVALTVTSLDGFAGSVSFTASSTKAIAAQTSFTINPVTVASGSSTSTAFSLLAYTTTTSKLDEIEHPGGWYRTGSGVVLAGLLLILLPRRRRLSALLVLALGVTVLSASGCASNNGGGTTTNIIPTPPGTYILQIAATATISGVVTNHFATITYTVQ